MKKILFNRYVETFAKSIIIFGTIHIVILFIDAFRGNIDSLNVFSIISLERLIPGVDHGMENFFLSYVTVCIVYCVVFLYWTGKHKKK